MSLQGSGQVARMQRGRGIGLAGRLKRLWRGLTTQLRHDLRFRMALGVGLPILLALSTLSLVHYWRQREMLIDQAELTAAQIGQVIIGGLRQSMVVNDPDTIRKVLADISTEQSIDRAQIVDLAGNVLVDSGLDKVGQVQHVVEPGCNTCHRLAAERRPRTVVIANDAQLIRVAVPIFNGPECHACHDAQAVHLGILLVEVPMRILWPRALANLQLDLAISAGLTLLMSAGLYWLLHRLVVRRVEAFRAPLTAFAAGNFDVRLAAGEPADEIDQLALTFNGMAEQLEQHQRAERVRSELRQQAIVQERERIARELHDGLAQVLGYVHTKATAIRLLLNRKQVDAAQAQLLQLEEAARGLFVDVREAILGLKMTGQNDLHLAAMLQEYAAHFSQLSDLPVQVDIAPTVAELSLSTEVELQLLRIVQEALTNARKHARASHVCIRMANGGPTMEVSVSDDGQGFEPDQGRGPGRPHFGLGTMRERAEAIGADFGIDSRPGAGTRVCVRLPVHPNGH